VFCRLFSGVVKSHLLGTKKNAEKCEKILEKILPQEKKIVHLRHIIA
jgi:hypothetical protein